METALERAKAHWSAKLDAGPRIIEVPEWGDDSGPLKIYVFPANLAQRNKVFQKAKGEDLNALADVIILRARTEAGTPIFKPGDRAEFTHHIDPDVVASVAGKIMEDLEVSEEAVDGMEKN